MIDPVTAIAGATKAFTMVKAMVEAGRSAEDTMMQIGKWYGHASDVIYAEKKTKKVNPFKRVVFSRSVQAEAMQAFAAKKRWRLNKRTNFYNRNGIRKRRITRVSRDEATDCKRAIKYSLPSTRGKRTNYCRSNSFIWSCSSCRHNGIYSGCK